MTRQLKPQQVSIVEDNVTGISVPIMLDRNTLEFFAQMPEKLTLRGKDAEELRERVKVALTNRENLNWFSVIDVTVHGAGSYENNVVGFSFKRYWLARRNDGAYLQVKWQEYFAGFNDGSGARTADEVVIPTAKELLSRCTQRGGDRYPHFEPQPGPGIISVNKECVLLPYTFPLWTKLQKMSEHLTEIRKKLIEMLTTKKGITQILAGSHKLLNA
jgi:hypothetical protein